MTLYLDPSVLQVAEPTGHDQGNKRTQDQVSTLLKASKPSYPRVLQTVDR